MTHLTELPDIFPQCTAGEGRSLTRSSDHELFLPLLADTLCLPRLRSGKPQAHGLLCETILIKTRTLSSVNLASIGIIKVQ